MMNLWRSVEAAADATDSAGALSASGANDRDFYRAYFGACRDTVKAIAPNKLYLGCRFIGYRLPLREGENEVVLRASDGLCSRRMIRRRQLTS